MESKTDLFYPSNPFYQAATARQSAFLRVILEREKIPYTLVSLQENGKFMEHFYVESKSLNHFIENEILKLDIQFQRLENEIAERTSTLGRH